MVSILKLPASMVTLGGAASHLVPNRPPPDGVPDSPFGKYEGKLCVLMFYDIPDTIISYFL